MRASAPTRRARLWFWALTVLAVLLTGALSSLIEAAPSPSTGIGFALSAGALAITLVLLARIVVALGRTRRLGRTPAPRDPSLRLFGRLARWLDRESDAASAHRGSSRG